MNSPILFLTFNKPNETMRVLSEIKKSKPVKLYIASDHGRETKQGEMEIVSKLRKDMLNFVDWNCEVKTLYRERNLGCKIGVSSAIDWFFQNEEEGIIIEEDCLPRKGAIEFMEIMLDKYRDNTKVMQVSATSYVSEKFKDQSYPYSYYFNLFPLIWGWGTWRRSWSKYDLQMKSYPENKANDFLKQYFHNPEIKNGFYKVFDSAYNNQVNTWDYQWLYTCLVNNSYCVEPKNCLVQNIGFIPEATHTEKIPEFYKHVKFMDMDVTEIKHPELILHSESLVNFTLRVAYVGDFDFYIFSRNKIKFFLYRIKLLLKKVLVKLRGYAKKILSRVYRIIR
ncbi:MAG: hypothetical protein SFU98_15005 [Leptospiraceae bacterium]|nr:hypothetical protein [Leptospiraceae bacterium]